MAVYLNKLVNIANMVDDSLRVNAETFGERLISLIFKIKF